MPRPMPRLFVIRHGETEWSLNGRHTGRTDIPLTARGEQQVKEKATILIGEGRPIDPKNLCTVFVSPRQRAHKTFHLLFGHVETPNHILTEEAREWDYGEYEGLLSSEIKEKRPHWNIWLDGCPGGESVEQMENRVDRIIDSVRKYHREYHEEGLNTRDVVIVAHGHFSRVLISRWIQFPLKLGTHFNVEPGGVAVLSYNHNTLAEPALNALNLYADLR
ncbi:phosphoglycerate mutase-like protein [Lentinula edodes]|uniref:Phosphoglycerate mutase-like protein n=1 Tax=Lentinula edodes TaxID=5353 RepID=A0A1Q3EFQ8_LENED|nr:phosphoglycerate mutase-like protein [Lentinula edodes]KAH7870749.1 phosphoglycerate mutase-like protein [Lentinula edodes]KAJ3918811.1 phosphoglycerate mutase-like protein [Lentinula edodes]GAW06033.1 phosphoglycerate mutase-like protein [Lentinula edodes]